MKALTTNANALRVALAPSTPRTGDYAEQLLPQLFGTAALYIPAPPPLSQRAYRTKPGGNTSRGRARTTANIAPFWRMWGLAGVTSPPNT